MFTTLLNPFIVCHNQLPSAKKLAELNPGDATLNRDKSTKICNMHIKQLGGFHGHSKFPPYQECNISFYV